LGICCFGEGPSDKTFIHAVHKGAKAMMTFCVIDDEGHPVTEANIETGFDDPAPGQSIYNQKTDTNGSCVVTGNTRGGMWFRITKADFYQTEGNCYFRSKTPPYVVDGKWQPWNLANTVVLKPIKNPVAMYVKQVEAVIPVLDQSVGFDLEKGDWVVPHGTGSSSDFVFKFSFKTKPQTYKDDFKTQMTLSFSNSKDGILDVTIPVEQFNEHSVLKLPYQAQSNDYRSAYEWQSTRINGKSAIIPECGDYIFRVRTKVDDSGKIISALYGKIHGSIETGGYLQALPRLLFTYYLNPTPNDRNIEFDPEKNLFGGRDRFAP
jgi:hypothetical protein